MTRLSIVPVLAVAFWASVSSAQPAPDWQAIGAPSATVFALARDPHSPNVFMAGTYFGGLQRSVDGGFTWQGVASPFNAKVITAIAYHPAVAGTVYVGSFEGGLFRTSDSGSNWVTLNNGLADLNVEAIAVSHQNPLTLLVATAGGGVLRSIDGGLSWTVVLQLTSRVLFADPRMPGVVLSGGPNQLYVSTDDGGAWTVIGQPLSESVASIAIDPERDGGYLVATSAQALRLNTTNGVLESVNSNLPPRTVHQFLAHPSTNRWHLATDGGVFRNTGSPESPEWSLWAAFSSEPRSVMFSQAGAVAHVPLRHGTMFASIDDGATWNEAVNGIRNEFVGSLAARSVGTESVIWAGSDRGTAVTATLFPDGAWARAHKFEQGVFRLAPHPTDAGVLFAGTERAGVWKSTDWGMTWTQRSAGLVPRALYVLAQSATQPTTVFAATSSGPYVSRDGGRNWRSVADQVLHPTYVLALTILPDSHNTVYFGTSDGHVFTSFDGITYMERSDGLPPAPIIDLEWDGYTLLAVVGTSLFKLNATTGRWQQEPIDLPLHAMSTNPAVPGIMYLGTATGGIVIRSGTAFVPASGLGSIEIFSIAASPLQPNVVYAGSRAIHRSTDGGLTWTAVVSSGLPAEPIIALQVEATPAANVYAQVAEHGTFKSVDGGITWTLIRGGKVNGALLVDRASGDVVTGAQFAGVFRSSDAGGSWQWSADGMSVFTRGLAIDPVTPDRLYAGAVQGGFYRTTDGGATWMVTGLLDKLIQDVAVHRTFPQVVFAATTEGVFRSVDFGQTWSSNTLRDASGVSLFAMDVELADQQASVVYAGTGGHGVWKSTDFGHSWVPASTGLTVPLVLCLAVDPSNPQVVYAGTAGGGVFVSNDGAFTWAHLGNIANKFVTSLVIDPRAPATVYAGTEGGGVFRLTRP